MLLVEELNRIQAETLLLNEDSQNNQNNEDNNNDIDNDLDKLLQQQEDEERNNNNQQNNNTTNTSTTNDTNKTNDQPKDLNDIPDLNADISNNGQSNDQQNINPPTNTTNQNNGDQKNFETDTAGLVDAITKLTKEGKTVKIVVSAEGQDMFLVNGKNLLTLQQLCEYANPNMKGAGKSYMNSNEAALRKQLDFMSRRLEALEKGQPLVEDRIIKIRESDYNILVESIKDLNFKVDEQAAQLRGYEALSFDLNENEINEYSDALDEMIDSLNEMNENTRQLQLKNTSYNSFNLGSDSALGIMTENIMPVLSSVHETKTKALSALDEQYSGQVYTPIYDTKYVEIPVSDSCYLVDEAIESLEKLNMIDRYRTLIESKITDGNTYSYDTLCDILDEASSDIVVTDRDNSVNSSLPQYQYFSKHVSKLLSHAYESAGSYKSAISAKNDMDLNYAPRGLQRKLDLPIMNPEKWNAPTTIKSAIMNLNENLRDIDGNLNLALCENAFLYKRVSRPESTDDFAFPIAIVSETDHKLYACPALIESVSKLLAKDTCVKTYNLKDKEELIALRESLMPYLNKLGMDAPWNKKK